MPVEIIDMVKTAHELKKRKVLLNTKRFHAWVHYYPNPGDKDDMHCHNADQSFYVIEGECTMHFPDGTKEVLRPVRELLKVRTSLQPVRRREHWR